MAHTGIDLSNGEQVQGTLPVANGGTGGSDASAARTNLGVAIGTNVQAYDSNLTTWAGKTPPTGALVGTTDTQALTHKDLTDATNTFPSTLALATQVAPSVYTATIGNGALTSFTITHNLNTRNVTVTVYDTSTYEVIKCDRVLTSVNTLTLTFQSAPSTNAYAVVVLGGALLSQPSVYTATIGDGASTSITVTHNLGTRSVNVVVYDASTYKVVGADRTLTSTNSITLGFQSAPALNSLVVVIQGGILSSTAVGSTNITDATTIGKNLLTASNAASALSLLTPLVSGLQTAYVATSETTASASYTDLTTTTDTVTATIGSSGLALVILYCAMRTNASDQSFMGFAMSGANTLAAADNYALMFRNSVASTSIDAGAASAIHVLTGLSSGSTTFKAKYKVGGGTGTFQYRRITVIPL